MEVIPLGNYEHFVSRKQLAQYYGFSLRWVSLRTAEGMPSQMFGNRRRYLLSETNAWLAEQEKGKVAA